MTIVEQNEDTNIESKSNEVEDSKSFDQQSESKLINEKNICFCDRAPGPSQNLRPRPHFKADYCLEIDNRQKVTIKNDVLKRSESSKILTTWSASTQEKNSFLSQPKSIFSCAMPPKRNNSVIIEELPNETCNNNFVNEKCKSSKVTSNKNSSNTKIANNDKTSGDKKLDVKKLNKNHEQNDNFDTCDPTSSPRKIQVANKYEIKTSKSEKYVSKVCF